MVTMKDSLVTLAVQFTKAGLNQSRQMTEVSEAFRCGRLLVHVRFLLESN